MPFKHKSGSRKGQEKKEQEEKAAKLPKLDYFGFLTSRQLVASPRSQQCSGSAGIRIAASALSGVSATMQQLTIVTARNVMEWERERERRGDKEKEEKRSG